MIDCPAPELHSHSRVARRLAIAGCQVDFALDCMTERGSASAEAAWLAEHLVAARLGCEDRTVRVAPLQPSGRPVAMVRGRPAAVHVSVSHVGSMIAAAACDSAGIGIDIVDPTEAGRALDVWFTPDELALLPDDDGLLRARLWGAKEAAFKAARLDDGFRPRSVEIEHLGRTGFRWHVRGEHAAVCGQGIFTVADMHLVAMAVAADAAEAVACS
jgi:4'-phosphopantetheinyl transferase EntD